MCVYGEKLLCIPFDEAVKNAGRYHDYWNELIANGMEITKPFPEDMSRFLADIEPYKSIMKGFLNASPEEQGAIWQKFLVGVLVSLLVASQFVQLAEVHAAEEKRKLEVKESSSGGWWSWWIW
ncbi:unnamed protein product [Orchesella dallaii]|uniref:Uncharacterized protein n=1 Tax=Orchesella dallaii TaxID=48710 RepID=A0ABP1RDJ6_9HEXA